MERTHYSFMDIISLNGNEWDKAYKIMNIRISQGKLAKVIRGPENIIYLPLDGLQDPDLIHDLHFSETISFEDLKRGKSIENR